LGGRPAGGARSTPPDPLAGFRGRGKGRGGEGKKEGGRERKGEWTPQFLRYGCPSAHL